MSRARQVIGELPRVEVVRIVRTSASIVGSAAVTSGLGFVFWWVAARNFDPPVVGLASATVSAMLLLAKLSSHGLGTSLAGALASRRTPAARLLVPGLITAAGLSAVLGLAFAFVARALSPDLGVLAHPPVAAVFAAGVALSAAGSVLDQALVGLMRGGTQLVRNVAFAVGKLAFLAAAVAAAADGALVIVTVWIAGEAGSLIVLAALGRPWSALRVKPDWAALRLLGGDAATHHILNVARFAPSLAMPIVVTALFSAEVNASFYVAYLVANATQLVSASSTFTLYAAARRAPEHLARQLRLTVLLSLGAVIPAIAALVVVGGPLLGIIGPSYAEEASQVLPILAALSVPLIVKDHWIALARIRGSIRRGAMLTAVAAVLEFAGAIIGGSVGGLEGLAAGWFAGVTLGAAAQLPTVLAAAMGVRPVNTPPPPPLQLSN